MMHKIRHETMLRGFFVLCICMVFVGSAAWASIVTTKHNLSASGPGTIKAVSEAEICVFCHTPHGAGTELPLWNHALSVQTYTLPTSANPGWAKLRTTVQQPDMGSRLCLSCHDGTVAIGQLVNMPGPGSGGKVAMQTGDFMIATDYGYIGTNLSGSHPVSIAVNDQLITAKNACTNGVGSYKLQYPPANDPVKLKPTGNTYGGLPGKAATSPNGQFAYYQGVQCSSCHDPHLAGVVDFLVAGTGTAAPTKGHPGNVSALCASCHPGTCP